MNSHEYSLDYVLLTLKLAIKHMNFNKKDLFCISCDKTSLAGLKEYIKNFLEKKTKVPFLDFKKEYNKNNKQNPISSRELAFLAQHVLINGNILPLDNLKIYAAWLIFYDDLKLQFNFQKFSTVPKKEIILNKETIKKIFLNFIDLLCVSNSYRIARVLHDFLHLSYLITKHEKTNNMERKKTANMIGTCFLNGLELEQKISQPDADIEIPHYSALLKEENEFLSNIIDILLDCEQFSKPFKFSNYNIPPKKDTPKHKEIFDNFADKVFKHKEISFNITDLQSKHKAVYDNISEQIFKCSVGMNQLWKNPDINLIPHHYSQMFDNNPTISVTPAPRLIEEPPNPDDLAALIEKLTINNEHEIEAPLDTSIVPKPKPKFQIHLKKSDTTGDVSTTEKIMYPTRLARTGGSSPRTKPLPRNKILESDKPDKLPIETQLNPPCLFDGKSRVYKTALDEHPIFSGVPPQQNRNRSTTISRSLETTPEQSPSPGHASPQNISPRYRRYSPSQAPAHTPPTTSSSPSISPRARHHHSPTRTPTPEKIRTSQNYGDGYNAPVVPFPEIRSRPASREKPLLKKTNSEIMTTSQLLMFELSKIDQDKPMVVTRKKSSATETPVRNSIIPENK